MGIHTWVDRGRQREGGKEGDLRLVLMMVLYYVGQQASRTIWQDGL